MSTSSNVRALRPPSRITLKGCGCLLSVAMVFAIADFCVALAYRKVALGSLLLLYAGVQWYTIIRNMGRLHRPSETAEIWDDAEDSTYRSPTTERAFRASAYYLPGLAIALMFVRGLSGDEVGVLAAIPSTCIVSLGIFSLAWRRKFRELRYQQAQRARDHLAEILFADQLVLNAAESAQRSYFLYLRPFSATGALATVPEDAPDAAAIDLETRLADAVAFWGPLIALGAPGEARGAGRMRVDESEWQLAVSRAARDASSILMLPSLESGVRWELALLRRERWLERTVFVQPPRTDRFTNEWWQAVRATMEQESLSAPEDMLDARIRLFTIRDDGIIDRVLTLPSRAGAQKIQRALMELGDTADGDGGAEDALPLSSG